MHEATVSIWTESKIPVEKDKPRYIVTCTCDWVSNRVTASEFEATMWGKEHVLKSNREDKR